MTSEAFENIVEDFALFDDWEDRYRHVVELGRDMPPLEAGRRTDAARVEGCASQVWLVPDVRDEADGPRLYFEGDSDAMIVRGLIAILRALLSGARIAEVAAMDVHAELGRLGLEQHLSSQRSNGLRALVARLKDIARASRVA